MTPALRTYHRLLWRLLAVFIPVIFIAAIMALPAPVAVQNLDNYQPEALPELWKTAETPNFIINWRAQSTDGAQQLEIVVKSPLTVPAALVYLAEKPDSSPERSILIGNLSATGIHRFRLGSDTPKEKEYSLLFFDPVKNTIFEKLTLSGSLNGKTINNQ